MTTLLTIILIGFAAAVVFRIAGPAPQPQIIYVEVERPTQTGGIGCVPIILIALVALVILLAG